MRGSNKIYLDEDIASALRACGGSVVRAAEWLGCSLLTVRNRVGRSKALQKLRTPGRRGRPPEHYADQRIVSSEQIVIGLDRSDSVKAASEILGVARQTMISRAAISEDVAAALTRCEERWKASERARMGAHREQRRAAVAESMARADERDRLIGELRASWQRARDTWIAEARAQGLSMKDMGLILGITRERVRQLEQELGMRGRHSAKRKVA